MLLNQLQLNYEGVVQNFPHNNIRKNYFLAACKYFLETKLSRENESGEIWSKLEELDRSSPYGGFIGPGKSIADDLFRWSKVVRLHAILHDAAGEVRNQYQIGPGYPYAGSCCGCSNSNSKYFGQCRGLLFCFKKKVHSKSFDKLEF